MHSEGSRFTFGGLGVDPYSRDPASGVRNRLQPLATVCNRSQPSAAVRLRPSWLQSCCAHGKSRKNVSFSTSQKMWSCRFAWQAWHFVTFNMCEVRDPREAEVAVPMGKVARPCLFRHVKRCGHVALRGRRGTLCHSTCVRCATLVRLKLPCLWEKLQERVFFDVSKDVVMSLCVAGVALCDSPHVWRCATLVRLKLPCLWEKSQDRVFFDVSKDVVMSLCVAGVALCVIPRV